MIAAGQSEDKPEISSRIEWIKAGVNLKTNKPKPNQIKSAVDQILGSVLYQQKAQSMKMETMQYNATKLSVELLEKLVANNK